MAKRVRIKVNLPALLVDLSREEGRAITAEEALHWLHEAGFSRDGAYWTVTEADLGHLDPSEVLEIEPVNESA